MKIELLVFLLLVVKSEICLIDRSNYNSFTEICIVGGYLHVKAYWGCAAQMGYFFTKNP